MKYNVVAECHPPPGMPVLPEIFNKQEISGPQATLAIAQLLRACEHSGVFTAGGTVVIKITEATP